MMKKLSLAALSLIAVLIVTSIFLTRDGSLVTPQGVGKVVINGKDFEAFPLPPVSYTHLTLPTIRSV